MGKNNIIKSVNIAIMIWIATNIILFPVYSANAEEILKKSIFSEDILEDKININGEFSKIIPLKAKDNGIQIEDKTISFFNIFFLIYLVFILLAGFYVRKNKKSQVTLFIIVFIVIAAVFMMLFYYTNKMKSGEVEREANMKLDDFLESSKVRVLMQNCIEKVTSDGIELLGLQGGRLYYDYPNDYLALNYRWGIYSVNHPQLNDSEKGDKFKGPNYNNNCPSSICNKFGEQTVPYSYPDYFNLNTNSSKHIFSQLILTSQYAITKPNYDIINWPYEGSFRTNYTGVLTSPERHLGKFKGTMNALCYSRDQELYKDLGIKEHCPYKSISGPGIFLNQNTYSMESKLESFLNKNVYKCFTDNLNSSFFLLNLSLDIQPNFTIMDELPPEVFIGEEDITVLYYFPLTVKVKGGTPVTKILEFKIKQKTRLKQIFDLVLALVEKETRDIFFRLDQGSIATGLNQSCQEFVNLPDGNYSRNKISECFKPGMRIDVREVQYEDRHSNYYCNTSFYDNISYPTNSKPNQSETLHCKSASVITITDYNSTVNEKPFEYIFSIENRAPALDLIDRKVPDDPDDNITYDDYIEKTYNPSTNENPISVYEPYKIGAVNNTPGSIDYPKHIIITPAPDWPIPPKIRLLPRAIDPDDEEVNYRYEGWLTNVNIKNETSSPPEEYTELAGTLSSGTGIHVSGGSLPAHVISKGFNSSVWEESGYYNGTYENNPTPWTGHPSDKFVGKDANYAPTWDDVGYHYVRVIVEDKDEPYLKDYQDVFIQVRCNTLHECCGGSNNDYHYRPLNDICQLEYFGGIQYPGACNNEGKCCGINHKMDYTCIY
ncbi:MAG: hypothetical protein V1740_06405 [Candidatus Woesearchaeota archaeon]